MHPDPGFAIFSCQTVPRPSGECEQTGGDCAMNAPGGGEVDPKRLNEAWKVFAGQDPAAVVREGFWPKMLKFVARVPFASEALAAFYCATDPATPAKVKGMLLAALAYFVVPVDLIPDLLPGIGFTDDLTVLATTIGMLAGHITDDHRQQARKALEALRQGRLPVGISMTAEPRSPKGKMDG